MHAAPAHDQSRPLMWSLNASPTSEMRQVCASVSTAAMVLGRGPKRMSGTQASQTYSATNHASPARQDIMQIARTVVQQVLCLRLAPHDVERAHAAQLGQCDEHAAQRGPGRRLQQPLALGDLQHLQEAVRGDLQMRAGLSC